MKKRIILLLTSFIFLSTYAMQQPSLEQQRISKIYACARKVGWYIDICSFDNHYRCAQLYKDTFFRRLVPLALEIQKQLPDEPHILMLHALTIHRLMVDNAYAELVFCILAEQYHLEITDELHNLISAQYQEMHEPATQTYFDCWRYCNTCIFEFLINGLRLPIGELRKASEKLTVFK